MLSQRGWSKPITGLTTRQINGIDYLAEQMFTIRSGDLHNCIQPKRVSELERFRQSVDQSGRNTFGAENCDPLVGWLGD
jgi:hypothetical protein